MSQGERAKDPKEDIEALDINLERAQLNYTLAAQELGYQRSIVKAIKPFWNSVELSKDSPPVLTSGAMVISDWRVQSQTWNTQSEHVLDNITFLSSTASTAAVNAVSMQITFMPQSISNAINVKDITDILSQRDERALVERGLSQIDKTVLEGYQTAWQYLHLPAFDRMRGPLFLMRQVFDSLLDKLAPDEEVMSQPGFVPDEKLKERNGKGITRPHRIEFVANTRITDPVKRKLVLDSTRNFTDIYDALNMAHDRHTLNEEAARNAVFAASKLIAEWLRAMGFITGS